MVKGINPIWFFLMVCACAFNPQQVAIARQVLRARGVPPWSVIIDAVQQDNIAYTDADRLRVYIDGNKLRATPRTFANVVTHEVAHLNGATHGDGTPEMKYAVTLNPLGEVVEDGFVLLPNIKLYDPDKFPSFSDPVTK